MPDHYHCSVCSFTTPDETDFTLHMEEHTGGEACYICPDCKTGFSDWDLVVPHQDEHARILKEHLETGPRRCYHCGEIYSNYYSWNRHLENCPLIEDATSRFKCPCCNKPFFLISTLQLHVKKEHPVDGVSTHTERLSNGIAVTCTTHTVTNNTDVMRVSQLSSDLGTATVTNCITPQASVVSVSQNSEPTVTTVTSRQAQEADPSYPPRKRFRKDTDA